MVTIQTVVTAAGGNGNEILVDFYTVIATVCGAVLFAKSATHKAAKSDGWWLAHLVCVIAALGGLVASIFALGWGVASEADDTRRTVVACCAVVASLILMVDLHRKK